MRITVLLVAVGLLTPAARAASMLDILDMKQPNIHMGQLQLHPYYALTQSYDSNFSPVRGARRKGGTPGGGGGGWGTTTTPWGWGWALPVGRLHHFGGNYQVEQKNSSRQSSANDNVRQ